MVHSQNKHLKSRPIMAHQQNVGRLAAHLCDMAFLRGVAVQFLGARCFPNIPSSVIAELRSKAHFSWH